CRQQQGQRHSRDPPAASHRHPRSGFNSTYSAPRSTTTCRIGVTVITAAAAAMAYPRLLVICCACPFRFPEAMHVPRRLLILMASAAFLGACNREAEPVDTVPTATAAAAPGGAIR